MNVPDQPEPISLDTLLSTSWRLLQENVRIVVPMLLVFVPLTIIAIPMFFWVTAINAASPAGAEVTPQLRAAFAIFPVVWLVFALVGGIGYMGTFAMADDLWVRGKASVGDAMRAAFATYGQLVLALLVLLVVEIAAFGIAAALYWLTSQVVPVAGIIVLAIPTCIILAFVAGVFLLYVAPAVIARRTAIAAIAESVQLGRRWFGQSAVVVVVLIAIEFGISLVWLLVNALFRTGLPSADSGIDFSPGAIVLFVLGLIIGTVVSLGTSSFFILVIVGMYRSLRGLAEQPAGALPTEVPPAGAEA